MNYQRLIGKYGTMQGSNHGILKAPHNFPEGTEGNHDKPNTIQPYYENWYEPEAERLQDTVFNMTFVRTSLFTLAENG
jgi:hypothetical protein